MKKIKLLWLTENYYPNPGGMARSCDRIVQGLRAKNVYIDVIHFCKKKRTHFNQNQQQGNDISWPLGENPAHGLNELWHWLNHSQRPIYTHIVAFGGLYTMHSGRIFSAWMSIPLITLLRGNDFDIGILDIKRSEILKDVLLHSSKVLSVSHDKTERLTKLFPQVDCVTIGNGVDTALWKKSQIQLDHASSWRKKEVLKDVRVLGVFGQLKTKKGVQLLVESIVLSGLTLDVHLLLVGDLEDEFLHILNQQKYLMYTHIAYCPQHQLASYYLACDAIIIPSLYDGLPNVLLEAGSLGKAVIASDTAGMHDVIATGETGYLFYPGDIHECRQAIDFFVHAPMSELERLGNNLRSHIKSNYQAIDESSRYLDVFKSI